MWSQRSWLCNNAQISSPWHKAACIHPLLLHRKPLCLVAAELVRLLYPERAKGHKGTWVRYKGERHLLWKITGSQKKTALSEVALDIGEETHWRVPFIQRGVTLPCDASCRSTLKHDDPTPVNEILQLRAISLRFPWVLRTGYKFSPTSGFLTTLAWMTLCLQNFIGLYSS